MQQLQQQPLSSGTDGNAQMAQFLQLQLQMSQMQQQMMSIIAQQQGGGGNAAPSPQTGMIPTWNQHAFSLNQAFPSSFPSVGTSQPLSAPYAGNQYKSPSMHGQNQQGWAESRPSRRLIKGLTENDLRNFTCSITHEIMWDPVVASDGHTYERAAIEQWLAQFPDGQALSPMTQLPMGRTVYPNKIIADLIRDKQAKS